MTLFEFLNIARPDITPQKTKIHLAGWNGSENPLDVFLSGHFEAWQRWQSKRNFERAFIVALIQLKQSDRWLFAGAYLAKGSEYITGESPHHAYDTEELPELRDYAGRLVIDFSRTGRQAYLLAENWADELLISEMYAKRVVVEDFKGYDCTSITKSTLNLIVNQHIESWYAALSNVSGVYLITDTKTGKLYVGSATGSGGIWQRWCDYAHDGHGGNQGLQQVLSEQGQDYAVNFRYSILEIADTHASSDDVLARESYWKTLLCSKEHGYNGN